VKDRVRGHVAAPTIQWGSSQRSGNLPVKRREKGAETECVGGARVSRTPLQMKNHWLQKWMRRSTFTMFEIEVEKFKASTTNKNKNKSQVW
jgi:hypothetical protein